MKTIYSIFLNMLFVSVLYAQVAESTLAPHYLYQFSNHIQKPNKKTSYGIHIIGSDTNLKRAFNKVLKNKKTNGKNFLITQSRYLTIPKNIDMIYIAPNSEVPFSRISDYVVGKSILLISFNESDKKNVMINIFLTPEEKLGFEINRANILNEGFSISDQVVLMGGTELDVAKLFKGAKQSLQKNELILKKNKLALKKSNEKLEKAKEKLLHLEKQTKKYLEDINKAKKSIERINADMNKEKKVYKQQIIKNKTLEDMVLENKRINIKVKEDLEKMLDIIKKKDEYIRKREKDLEVLNKDISDKEKSLNELSEVTQYQGEQITVQEDMIDTQKNFLFWLIIALGIFLLFVIIIISMLREQRVISKKLQDTLVELEETQEDLIQSAKMASLGELVSGLAHEMNTPIGICITGNSILKTQTRKVQEKLTAKALKQSDLTHYFEVANEITESNEISLEKAAQLIKSFKQVSIDQQVDDLRKFNLSEYIETILISYKSQLKNTKIDINVYVDESLEITSYPGIYYQVLTNIINNSLLHAFSEGDEGTISIRAEIDEDTIHLIYKDSGKGVSEKNLSRIFEPFFTTKRANGGTGLGLHIIYNLITQKLQGNITAKSKEGEGLIMDMKLPLKIR